MPFIDIARAVYAYSPQSSDELAISENDFLYVVEKGGDDWWRVKKKVDGDDDGPVGLVPRNYLEDVSPVERNADCQVAPISTTRTLYDYAAQTDEELSFPADVAIEIFDKDDPDWFLVRLKGANREWEYGFVPSNYLDDGEVESAAKLPSVLPAGRPDSLDEGRPLTPEIEGDEDDRDGVEEPISPSNAVVCSSFNG
jgi:actin cytoskeleton-regulatory complex protein SLA1